MDRIRVQGGTALCGEVSISGAKNASLPLMAAALLAPSASVLIRIPDLRDINTMIRMLEHLGAVVERIDDGLKITSTNLADREAPYDLVRQMRASIYVLGPMLARFGHARVSLPGGCAIGTRPIDLHLRGLEALGATIKLEHGYVEATAPSGGLRGAEFSLSGPSGSSVGATCNVLMAAVVAQGDTVIRGAAREPHVDNLIDYLNAMGARIEGAGSGTLQIEGVQSLEGCAHTVIADPIEAGSFMIAIAITQGDAILRNCNPSHMRTEIDKLMEMGAFVEVLPDGTSLHVRNDGALRPTTVRTAPYPGFATDMQAQFMVAMSLATGQSLVTENIYPERFMHVAELNRMGAEITINHNTASVRGVKTLSGAEVMASDLRASAALILAGLAAEGQTDVLRVYHLDRGYEQIEQKFCSMGACIERISS